MSRPSGEVGGVVSTLSNNHVSIVVTYVSHAQMIGWPFQLSVTAVLRPIGGRAWNVRRKVLRGGRASAAAAIADDGGGGA